MLISLVIAGAPAESASPGTRHPGKHKSCNDDAVQQHASIEAMKQFLIKKNCFNKIRKMLKQMKNETDIYNNWKILGDKTALF